MTRHFLLDRIVFPLMRTASALLALVGCAPAMDNATVGPAPVEPKSLYDFTVKDIEGKEVKLDKYKDKVVLVVNVASKCGLTPQYKGLEALYEKYKDRGFVVLGFPANDFMGQEPGTEEEIKTFCSTTYGVTFPMFSKTVVKGEKKSPLYQWLQASSDRPEEEVEWNFGKFLIGRDGKLAKRFTPRDLPDSLEGEIEKALGRR